jgi:hypothetical protein
MDTKSSPPLVDPVPGKGLSSENPDGKNPRDSVAAAVAVGLIVVAICFGWLFLTTHYLHNGNWTSVFYTGALRGVPADLAKTENIYLFPKVAGYDGQQYHLIAHDLFDKKGYDSFLDQPRARRLRILIPALAALFSFGNSDGLHFAYIAIVVFSFYLGAFWLARWSGASGFSSAWGLLFLIMPATLVSLLFMTVDGTLGALAIGFIWYAKRQSTVALYILLVCAALTREMGFFFIAGYCLWLLSQRQLKRAIVFGTAGIPALLWYYYVIIHTGTSKMEWFSPIPFLGVWRGIVGHWNYPPGQQFLLVLDFVAMAGMLLAFVFAFYYFVKRETRNATTYMSLVFLVFATFMCNEYVWPEVNGYGRYYTSLLLVIATTGMLRGNWWTLLPTALVDLRILSVFAKHSLTIVQAALGKHS